MTRDEADALYAEADRMFGAGQNYEARKKLETVVAAFPDHADAQNYLGWLLSTDFERLFVDRGVVHLREAIRLRPDHRHASHNLGEALLATGDVDGAMQSFRRAIEILGEDSPLSHFGLALCHEHRGELRAALSAIRVAMQWAREPLRLVPMRMVADRITAEMRAKGVYFLPPREEESLADLSDDSSEAAILAGLSMHIGRVRRLVAGHPFAGSASAQLDAIEACIAAGRLLPEHSGREFLLGHFAARELDGWPDDELPSALSETQSLWDRLRWRWYRAGK